MSCRQQVLQKPERPLIGLSPEGNDRSAQSWVLRCIPGTRCNAADRDEDQIIL